MTQNTLHTARPHILGLLTSGLLFGLFFLAPKVTAQQDDAAAGHQSTGSVETKRNEFGVWGSISFDSPTWIGKTPDARFGNIGLRYGRVLAANDDLALSWTIDAVPVAVLSVNRFTLVPSGSGTLTFQRTRDRTYGAGLSPIGLKLNFRRSRMVQPFAAGTGGFLYFSKDVPVDGAKRFNFTFDFGGGVDFVRESGHAFSVGYKYQHISNGDRSPINPGVDVQLIYLGFSLRR